MVLLALRQAKTREGRNVCVWRAAKQRLLSRGNQVLTYTVHFIIKSALEGIRSRRLPAHTQRTRTWWLLRAFWFFGV